ncbi:MAG: HD domain-containing protein [Blastochloris sp.]|nr:HD domain-containing protein [Blastochloris sp.]
MTELSPMLIWPDIVLDLQDVLADHPKPIYIVGGAVRDALLRKPIKDIDLVTERDAIRLARTIANRLGGAFYPLDPDRDVGRALIHGAAGRMVIDVAGFRGGSLEADLADRDFTINAMAVQLQADLSRIIDPLGGIRDALHKQLRRCGPNAIANDPIRALRAVRQSIQFGLRIEPETLRDVRAAAPRLHDISPERLRDEVIKILALPRPTAALRVADALDLLGVLFPELPPMYGLQQHPRHAFDAWNHTLATIDALMDIIATINPARTDEATSQFRYGMLAIAFGNYRARLQDHLAAQFVEERPRRALLALAGLLHDIGKPATVVDEAASSRFPGHAEVGAKMAEARALALRFSSAEIDWLTTIIEHHMDGWLWIDNLSPLDAHRFWHTLGADGIDLILFMLADYLGAVGTNLDQDRWLRLCDNGRILLETYFDRHDMIVRPPTLVDGNDLMRALNLRPGAIIRELLDVIREAQVTGDVRTVDEALTFARRHLESRGA